MKNGEIIKAARELRGLGQEELAYKIGKSRQTLYRYENGESVPPQVMSKISEVLGIDVNYYIEHNKAPDFNALKESPAVYRSDLSPKQQTYVVKNVNDEPEEVPVAFVNVPEFENCVKFIVNDDSMAPSLFNGELMVARPAEFVDYFKPNRVYLAQLKDGCTIARIVQGSKEGFLTFEHDNDFYPSYDVPLSAIKALYLYVGKVARSDLRGIQLTSRLSDLEGQISELMEKAS